MENKIYDVIIIGGGCAGLTAAVYARRSARTVLLLESQVFGGQISYSPNVENFPGYKSISGLDFSDKLVEQATDLGTQIELENVESIKIDDNFKTVITDYDTHKAKSVIIATGLKHRKMNIEREEDFIGKGISYCAVCDGAFFKNKTVAVYGGGNTAVQDALFLSEICDKVVIIHRRDTFRADPHLVNQLNVKQNVQFLMDSTVTSLNGDNLLNGINVKNIKTGAEKSVDISGLFVAIGQLPQNEIFKDIVKLDEYGFIESGEDCVTSAKGIFAAGDCRTKDIRQLTTAAADGAVAATQCSRYIDSL